MIARVDRDQLRTAIRDLLGTEPSEPPRISAHMLQAEFTQPPTSASRPQVRPQKA
jgi:hypothetical protein